MKEREQSPDLIEAVLGLASVGAQILRHVARWEGLSAPDAPPPEDVFRTLLSATLRRLIQRHPPEAIKTAREIVVEAVELIEAEVLLVEPPSGPRERRLGHRSLRRPS
jgi:hypothetical protein